jgi:outer membrane receptor protein involved in Fe transport
MEEVDYGDSKNPLERNGEPIEKLPEATSLPDTELAGSEEALDTETEETGFIEFPLLEAESAAEVSAVLAEGEGRIVGQVFDKETGAPVRGVAIAVEGTELGTITDTEGNFQLNALPEGTYNLAYFKTGYLSANITDVAIASGDVKTIDFGLPPRPAELSGDVYDLGTVTVTADEANDLMMKLELRMDSDQMVDIFSAGDFSKFAARDVGEAIKRLPGVTVQEGKFAVIRGLDERYTSTLLNGVPVPSPDPDRQSVPLDLFPSDVVKNLSVTKTFSPDNQGNAGAGTINISTNSYSEEFQVNLFGGLSWNENALDTYIEAAPQSTSINFGDLGSAENLNLATEAINSSQVTPKKSNAPQEHDYSIDFSDTKEFFGRKFRYLANFSHEEDYETTEGTRHDQFANPGRVFPIPGNPRIINSGDLSEGTLGYSRGSFDTTQSIATERDTYLFSFNADLDKQGMHQIGYTFFRVEIDESTATIQENGSFESLSQSEFRDQGSFYEGLDDLFFGNGGYSALLNSGLYTAASSYETRKLETHQVIGEHDFSEILDGLSLDWVYSRSETSLDESTLVVNAIRLPDGSYNTGQNTDLGDDLAPSAAWRRIDEEQDYYNVELKYVSDLEDDIKLEATLGASSEDTEREVLQEFYFFSAGARELTNANLFSTSSNDLDQLISDSAGVPNTTSVEPDARAIGAREIDAYFFNGKLSLGEKMDFIGGVRYEDILMTTQTSSQGDFFNFELIRERSTQGSPAIRAIENAQIIGLDGPLSSDFTGVIDEAHWLPAFTYIYRLNESIRTVASYSQSVARPSFKEFTYITVQDPSTLDYVSGSPVLETSQVESYDLRVEYNGRTGDLFAIGAFLKTVDQPIERTSLFGNVQTDFYVNNPNSVDIYGIELEARKSLDFLENSLLSYFSLGGNLAFIEAEIGVSQPFQELFSGGFLLDNGQTVGGNFYANADTGDFDDPQDSRPLFNQPTWIANFDVNFDQPDWGTRVTLALFAQSDVLDSAGSYLGGVGNTVVSVDRYQKSFHQLDFALRQQLNDNFTLGVFVKNITDTERIVYYDKDVVSGADDQRNQKLGKEFWITLTAKF